MEFTYNGYRKLLHLVKNYDYEVCDFKNYQKAEKCVILRHDIDFSLDKALNFAEIENQLGITATYFFLLATDLYNIASKKGTEIISRIRDLGHQVGLHFDPTKYGITNDLVMLSQQLERERSIFNTLLDMEVEAVAIHRPSPFIFENDIDLNGLINPYSHLFFKQFKYVSDSRRFWRDDPEQAIIAGDYTQIQILTHPLWYGEEERSATEALKELVLSASNERYLALNNNIRNLSELLSDKDLSN